MNNYNGGSSRFEKREKKRKSNIVLNALIGIVFVLIIVIGYQLVLGGKEEASTEQTSKYNEPPEIKLPNEKNKDSQVDKKEEQDKQDQKDDENTDLENDSISDEGQYSDQDEETTNEGEEEVDKDPFAEATITEGSPGSGVKEVIENPSWEAVGTTQTGEHTASYKKNSQDWTEMTKALSYATAIPESDMIIWFLGNNGGPNDAVGTISPKDKSSKYKVYITWVDGQGWKPTKVEKLK